MLEITFHPKYRLTYIPKGRKTKETKLYPHSLTPMEILIEARKSGHTPTNIVPNPDCPAVIVLHAVKES